ncbi:MAG: hypothetical protein ABGW84_04075 [Sphingomonadaceae bacterium]
MGSEELFWTQVSALGQVAAAVGTFAAVILSLWLSLRSGRPKIKLRVGEWTLIGPEKSLDENLLVFSVANTGSRPAMITHIGWETGWLKHGPTFLKKQFAVQTFSGTDHGLDVPFDLPIGAKAECSVKLNNILQWVEEKRGRPFFSRDFPKLGRMTTKVRAYASTADGHTFYAKVDPNFVEKAASIEKKSDA